MTSRRWFHHHINGQEAEQLLMDRGTNGSFLCRPSSSKKDFTLSVRRNDRVTHIKIQNNGEYYDLYGGEQFSTLSELIQYYMEHDLHEKNGELIELKYPMNSKDPTSERWFHGHMSGKDAENLLMDKGKNGNYLVRESIRTPGDYVLTIRSDDNVIHVMIRNVNEEYDVGGGKKFNTITELVDYYKQNPMVESKFGRVVHLKQPFNATKITASSIGDRVVELQKDANTVIQGKDGFWEEFEQLQQQECKHRYSRNIGLSGENKHKNRFKNIVPFDHTRVILSGESDYINASYIDGESEHEYIATQGCLEETIYDFWRMVYQENSRVILMVTREIEKGKSRCAKYWPDINCTIQFNNFHISNIEELETPHFIYRELKLINEEEDEEEANSIYHYQYIGWPEHGIPSNVGSVIGILHDINLKQKYSNYPGPIIIHCSSGVGRTGAFIVIDILVKILQKQGMDCEIDIQKTVQLVRSQRPGMVQLEAQYKFIYLAIAHYVEMEHKLKQRATLPNDLNKKSSLPKRVDPCLDSSSNFYEKIENKYIHSQRKVNMTLPAVNSNTDITPPVPERKPKPLVSTIYPFRQETVVNEEINENTFPPQIPTRKKVS
ncbi:tyrosine-protein phosphatase non-receptor type 11 isoform X3 [Hydra vulgaris]|uniref:Tyrosine-protein phosphatase non-receptor type 11 isoform X3 n=1 Tax=Hydra vulgaris TaxID=6087 RepID=A0ABM4C3X5_HYDVU